MQERDAELIVWVAGIISALFILDRSREALFLYALVIAVAYLEQTQIVSPGAIPDGQGARRHIQKSSGGFAVQCEPNNFFNRLIFSLYLSRIDAIIGSWYAIIGSKKIGLILNIRFKILKMSYFCLQRRQER